MTSQALLVRRVGMLASRTNLTTKATPKRTKRTKKKKKKKNLCAHRLSPSRTCLNSSPFFVDGGEEQKQTICRTICVVLFVGSSNH
ncbi:hypothetical protein I7I50_08673 [Histoplasma capsulatum G186AR]|nr:hypothetical protein I7I50_08673 [Histoplasma capsulatum G186AR]